MVTREAVIEALRQVQEPELGRDLVTLNIVRDIEVKDGAVRCTIVLTPPACPLKADIKARCESAVRRIPGVQRIDVRLKAEVPRGRSTVVRLRRGAPVPAQP